MSRNTIDTCKSGSDFAHYVKNNPNTRDIRQNGSHLCVKGTNPGTAVIPVHGGDLPVGTRKSVIKMLKLIGLALLPMACLLSAMLAN